MRGEAWIVRARLPGIVIAHRPGLTALVLEFVAAATVEIRLVSITRTLQEVHGQLTDNLNPDGAFRCCRR